MKSFTINKVSVNDIPITFNKGDMLKRNLDGSIWIVVETGQLGNSYVLHRSDMQSVVYCSLSNIITGWSKLSEVADGNP